MVYILTGLSYPILTRTIWSLPHPKKRDF